MIVSGAEAPPLFWLLLGGFVQSPCGIPMPF
jgi:hypothetical protein